MPTRRVNNSSGSNRVPRLNKEVGIASRITLQNTNTLPTASPTTSKATITTPLSSLPAADLDLANEQKQKLYQGNAKLCQLVRKCPWMYDRNHANYAKKHVLDKSWAKIAKDCNDSVASCKERWRNIRTAFARSVNIYRTHSGPNRVKPYYMHEELCFLVKPMMEGRDRFKISNESVEGLIEFDGDNNKESFEIEVDKDTSKSIDQYQNEENTSQEHKIALESNMDVDLRCTEPKTHAQVYETEPVLAEKLYTAACLTEGSNDFSKRPNIINTDADAKFLETLLPDMKAMNTRQKIVFKRKIFQALEEVFDITTDFPAYKVLPIRRSEMINDCPPKTIINSTPKQQQHLATVAPISNKHSEQGAIKLVPLFVKEEIEDDND